MLFPPVTPCDFSEFIDSFRSYTPTSASLQSLLYLRPRRITHHEILSTIPQTKNRFPVTLLFVFVFVSKIRPRCPSPNVNFYERSRTGQFLPNLPLLWPTFLLQFHPLSPRVNSQDTISTTAPTRSHHSTPPPFAFARSLYILHFWYLGPLTNRHLLIPVFPRTNVPVSQTCETCLRGIHCSQDGTFNHVTKDKIYFFVQISPLNRFLFVDLLPSQFRPKVNPEWVFWNVKRVLTDQDRGVPYRSWEDRRRPDSYGSEERDGGPVSLDGGNPFQ